MPGVGMNAPRRYTASNASVNSTRLRRSGVLKILAKRLGKLPHDNFDLPTGRAIFSSADLLKAWARTVRATFKSPSPRILMPSHCAADDTVLGEQTRA